MVDIRNFITGNYGTLRTPQQYINAFNIKRNIDTMFGAGTSDEISRTINDATSKVEKAKQSIANEVNKVKSKAQKTLDKALKSPVVQKAAPIVNTVVGATGAANAADRASRYSLTTTPQEKIIDNTQRLLYGAGGITGALGLTPVSIGLNAAAMGLNAIPKNYIPQGSGVNNPADYANLYTPEQLAGRGLDPVSVARYLEIRDNANKQPQQVAKPVQVIPTSPQNVRSKNPQKSALDEINEYIDSRNNATPALPPLPSATGPAYLGQDSVGNFIRRNTGNYQPNIVDIPMPAGTNPTITGSAPVPTTGLNFTQAAGASGLDNNGNPYLQALRQPQVPQYIPDNYGNNTGNSGIPNLGFAANPYAQRLADEYDRLTNLDYQQLRQQDQLARVQAQARGALLGLNEPLAYTSDLVGLNDRVNALRAAAQYQDAMVMSDKYGMPLSAGFASPDTLVNNIYGPMFKAPLNAQQDYRDAMYKMTTDRAKAINDILVDTNKSELDKARDINKIERQFALDKQLQDERLENARWLEEQGNKAALERAEFNARSRAILEDNKARREAEKNTATGAKVPTLSSLVNSLANISMTPGMEDIANIVRNQILLYYGPQALENATNAVQQSNGNPSTINYFGE